MRRNEQKRTTKETDIHIIFDPDDGKPGKIDTGIPFFDHMISAFGRHGNLGLSIVAKGDLEIDTHHTIEDVGIVLGDAVKASTGEGKGIRRFAHAIIPMDESRAMVVLDCGGRGFLKYEGKFSGRTVGGVDTDLFEHFFYTLCSRAGITAHIQFTGRNDHHKCEAVFKAFGIALGEALSIRPGNPDIPSTKGRL